MPVVGVYSICSVLWNIVWSRRNLNPFRSLEFAGKKNSSNYKACEGFDLVMIVRNCDCKSLKKVFIVTLLCWHGSELCNENSIFSLSAVKTMFCLKPASTESKLNFKLWKEINENIVVNLEIFEGFLKEIKFVRKLSVQKR